MFSNDNVVSDSININDKFTTWWTFIFLFIISLIIDQAE